MATAEPDPLLEELVSAGDPERAGRALVAAALASGTAGAVLWRRAPGRSAWREVHAGGRCEGVPGVDQVDAVAAGHLPETLGAGRLVLVARGAEGALALALEGALAEPALDRLHALLWVAAALEAPAAALPKAEPELRPAPADEGRGPYPEKGS
jgi:hypothetical protein